MVAERRRPRTFVLAPIDQGAGNVGGREGAREAPSRLWRALGDREVVGARDRAREVDVENTAEGLEADLDRVADAVAEVLEADRDPVVLGGDHGITYATASGARRALGEVGVAYLDVHLDVRDFRPRHTSGSSFRRLIEEGLVAPERVRPLGIREPEDPGASSGGRASFAELAAWAREAGLAPRRLEEVRRSPGRAAREALAGPGSWCFSIDVDAVDRRWAPGVSAPGDGRFTLEEALAVARGARGRFRVLDLVEYAPPLDEDERTLSTAVALLEAALGPAG